MATVYFYMTVQGKTVVEKLQRHENGEVFDKHTYKMGVKDFWQSDNTLVFVMATGIVVRTIAPYIKSKTTDPAVLAIDQNGQFVISLLSGHLGGANARAAYFAELLGATPVITTATDIENVPALDMFAKANKLKILHIEHMKYVSGAMVAHQPLNIISQWDFDGQFPAWVNVNVIREKHCLKGLLRKINLSYPAALIGTPGFCAQAAAYYTQNNGGPFVSLTSAAYCVGTGCKKQMNPQIYENAFEAFLKSQDIEPADILCLTTIDIKKDEPCILKIAEKYHLALRIFSKDALAQVDMNNASGKVIETSEFVKQVTGVGSVSEASAYLAAGQGQILVGKTKYEGVTFALAEEKKVLKL